MGKGRTRGDATICGDTQGHPHGAVWCTAAVPGPYLGDGGEHDEDEEVVGHHEPLPQQEAAHAGQRVLLLRYPLLLALVPVAEVHDVDVVGHVGDEDPDVLYGQPVPGEGAAHGGVVLEVW